MLSSSAYVSLILALTSTVVAKQALQYNDNPTNVVAIADFPQGGKAKYKDIMGTMKFFSVNGTVKVHWDVTQLPPNKGPFYYKIHSKSVGRKGSCSSTGKTFNPFKGSSKCSATVDDSYCQVGDLSGKHGWINTTCFEASYYDPYLSLDPNDPSYIVGRSIVVFFPNKKKMACADIILSEESVYSADMESKRNIKHNMDLIENHIDGWKPTPEEEEMMDEAHKEWLKYNNEGDVHVDAENKYSDEIDTALDMDEDNEDYYEDEGLIQYAEYEDEQQTLSVESPESQNLEKLEESPVAKSDEAEASEEKTEVEESEEEVEEKSNEKIEEKSNEKVEEKSNEYEEEPKQSSSPQIFENSAAREISKYSLVGGAIGAAIGFSI